MLNKPALSLLILLSALTSPTAGSAAAQGRPLRPEAERIGYEQHQELVAGPARLLEGGDLAGAEAAFEALLARESSQSGPGSVAVADHLMAFGLLLFTPPMSDLFPRSDEPAPDTPERRRSLEYFRRAIPAFRSAFGPDHPEVALAIGTYAHAALELLPDDPPAGIEAALEEAHRIYAAVYGASDIAAARMLLHRAEVLGAPSRTRGEPERIAEAAARFRETAPLFAVADEIEFNAGLLPGALGVARMYVQHGRIGDALAAAEPEVARRERAGSVRGCDHAAARMNRLAHFMIQRGYRDEAEAMRRRIGTPHGCTGIEFFPLP